MEGRANVAFGVRAFDGFSSHSFLYVMGNRAVTLVANVLFNVYIHDLMTCHKVMRTEIFRALPLRIGIEEEQPVSGGDRRPAVARRGVADVVLVEDPQVGMGREQGVAGRVVGVVVDDDDLRRRGALGLEAGHRRERQLDLPIRFSPSVWTLLQERLAEAEGTRTDQREETPATPLETGAAPDRGRAASASTPGQRARLRAGESVSR